MDSAIKQLARRTLPRKVRNWLRSPSAALHWWLNERRAPIALPIRPDWTLQCPRNALDGAFRLQLYDPPQVRELDEFIALVRRHPGVRLLDIGSHFGVFSFAALQYGGPKAQAFAVDPSATAQMMLGRIADLNASDDRLRFLRAAAGAAPGELEMVDTGVGGAGYMVLPGDQPQADRTRIPQVTIDQLAPQLPPRPDIIKIDVESYELEVLRGGRATLAGARVILCLELHNQMMRARGVNPQAVLDLLREYGYAHFTCDGAIVSPAEMIQPEIIRVIATG